MQKKKKIIIVENHTFLHIEVIVLGFGIFGIYMVYKCSQTTVIGLEMNLNSIQIIMSNKFSFTNITN